MNQLSQRQKEVAELLAWGASKKEIASHLFISVRTVENHARAIFEKTGCNSSSELSAWWFCNRFNISMNLSPLAKHASSIIMLILYCSIMFVEIHPVTVRNTHTRHASRRMSRRRSENEFKVHWS